MNNPKYKFSGLLLRTAAVLVAGLMISAVFLANAGSLSWFVSSAAGTAHLSAAETEDIIESIEIIYEDVDTETGEEYNPVAVKLRKAQSFEPAPLIFFSIEGKAAEYVLHINPVRLDSNAYYIVPVETDINVYEYGLLDNEEEPIRGVIWIKYMNEYIDEPKEIAFTRDFLSKRLMADIIRGEVKTEEPQRKVSMMRIGSLIESPEFAASNNQNEKAKGISIEDMTIRAVLALAELVEWKGIDAVSDFSIGLNLTSNQEFLMDIIYPGLKGYVEGLKSYIGTLKAEIEEKNLRLASLDEQLASLEGQYNQLMEENAKLTEQINSLTVIPPPVIPPTVVQPPVVQPPAQQPPVTPGTDTAQPPVTGGGSTGGGSSNPDGNTPDAGTAPDNGTPPGDTGSGTEDGITGEDNRNSTSDSSTGDQQDSESQNGDTDGTASEPGTGETGDTNQGQPAGGDSIGASPEPDAQGENPPVIDEGPAAETPADTDESPSDNQNGGSQEEGATGGEKSEAEPGGETSAGADNSQQDGGEGTEQGTPADPGTGDENNVN